MEYRTLGRTGVKVSRLCLGSNPFGSWVNADHGDCIRIVHRALDAGINFLDTADVYSAGEAEVILGKALAGGRRDRVILTTKANRPMGDDVNERGNSRRWILRAVEASLRRLQTDWIDLFLLHGPDAETDLDESVGALTDLVREGKVRYIGTSVFPASQIVEAQWVSQQRGRQRCVCEQPPYSLLARGIEADVLPTCRRHDVGVMTWSPLAAGWLSGRWRVGADTPSATFAARMPGRFDLSLPANARKLEAADALGKLADEAGIPLVQLAIAFVLRHPAVTSAIVGARTLEHLESQFEAIDVILDEALLDRIDEIVPPGVTLNPLDAGPNADLEVSARR